MTAREEAARLEAVRLLDLAAAKVQSAQQLLQQPGWRDQVSTAYAAAEEAATEITKATKQAKKAEKEVAVTVKEEAEAAVRREKEAADEKMRIAVAHVAEKEAKRKATEKREKEEREAEVRAAKEAAAAGRAEEARQQKLERERVEMERKEARAKKQAEEQAEKDVRRAEQEARKAVEAKAAEEAARIAAEKAEEERRLKRAEALRSAAEEAERKKAAKKGKVEKELAEYEIKAKKQADEQAEKEARKLEQETLKAEKARAAEEAKRAKAKAAEEAKAKAAEETTAEKTRTPERQRSEAAARRSPAGSVANQRLERSSRRLSSIELTPRGSDDGAEEHEATMVSSLNTALRGMAIDKRAAELLAEKMDEKKKKLEATKPPAWLKEWRKGGSRSVEMEAEANFHGDCLAVGADGDTIFSVDGKRVGAFSASSGERLWSMTGHVDQVLCVAVSGELIASGGRDKSIRLWSTETGQCTATLAGSDEAIYGLATFGDLILSAEKGGHARLWSVSTRKCLALYAEHSGSIVWSAALHDVAAVTASHDTTARVWPVLNVDGLTSSLGTLTHPEAVFSVSLVDDCIATACGDRQVRLWSLSSLTCTHTLEHSAALANGGVDDFREGLFPFCVHLLSAHALVSGGGAEKSVKLWSLGGAGECVATMGHDATVRGVAASPAGFIASVGGKWKKLVVWRGGGRGSVEIG